jgi:hypothetical protein
MGSPAAEHVDAQMFDVCPSAGAGCRHGVDPDQLGTVRMAQNLPVCQRLSQEGWEAAVEAVERELEARLGKANPKRLWQCHGQPGELSMDDVRDVVSQKPVALGPGPSRSRGSRLN